MRVMKASLLKLLDRSAPMYGRLNPLSPLSLTAFKKLSTCPAIRVGSRIYPNSPSASGTKVALL